MKNLIVIIISLSLAIYEHISGHHGSLFWSFTIVCSVATIIGLLRLGGAEIIGGIFELFFEVLGGIFGALLGGD